MLPWLGEESSFQDKDQPQLGSRLALVGKSIFNGCGGNTHVHMSAFPKIDEPKQTYDRIERDLFLTPWASSMSSQGHQSNTNYTCARLM
jgi:hypothetical protein